MSETVKTYFTQSIQTTISAAELLAVQMNEGAQLITQTLLRDRKIFICGFGHCQHIGHIMAAQFLQHHTIDRPPLPVITLDHKSMVCDNSLSQDELFRRPLQALGQSGDLLIVLAGQSAPMELSKAVTTAQSKDMDVLILCGTQAFQQDTLSAGDIEIILPCVSHTQILEVMLTLTNYLTETVNQTLFPQQEYAT